MAGIGDTVRKGIGALFGLGGGQAFEAGRDDIQEMAGWRGARAHMDQVFSGQGQVMVERAEDLDRNSAWINGALDRSVEAVIGKGLQPWPTPIYDALEAQEIAFPWHSGDLLLIDNIAVAHGRNPFKGQRDVQVALFD